MTKYLYINYTLDLSVPIRIKKKNIYTYKLDENNLNHEQHNAMAFVNFSETNIFSNY